ncbi:hypothetical protein EIN_058990 [Entamoeba invadens IP1]|uniref:hypothetical protein n=1 Tax=Entamoeba invadens IP1 TaxID=370355 RepID=UPI0002C3DBC8|nr:hypothetical protein EIN_058990 [Entamoeba invadens IP1]ELP93434.1 hypothetical protein EIN_058990 [Entamoeba invadens IP1]|eukprot:XP_004260205.1 hypothetical protein EIN_058990 [Entamoeba invadens IP1]
MSALDLISHQPKDENVRTLLIFNPDIPTKEGEDEKKMLYCNSNQTHYSDIANLGLFQTLIGFFSQFSKPLTTVNMKKTKTFLYSPEPSFWVSYTISANVPAIDETGVEFLKFLCDTFIFLNGSFTTQHNTLTPDLFALRLKKFFDNVLPENPKDVLTSPGKFAGVQYNSIGKLPMTRLINVMEDIKARFPCITDFTLFDNMSFLSTTLSYELQSTLYNVFTVIREGSMDIGKRFSSLRTANDERRIVFGVPDERSKSKSYLSATQDILNSSVYIKDEEKKWIVYEHKRFFFHFFLSPENTEVLKFLTFLNSEMPDVVERIWSDDFVKEKKSVMPNTNLFYFNVTTYVKHGALSFFDRNDIMKMVSFVDLTKNGVSEFYIKGENGKWVVYLNIGGKVVKMVRQLNNNSNISNAYGDVKSYINQTFKNILY